MYMYRSMASSATIYWCITKSGILSYRLYVIFDHDYKKNPRLSESFPGQISFWTDGRRPDGGDPDEFYWTHNNASFTFNNWHTASAQPYETNPDDDCVSAYIGWDFMWNDYTCSTRNMYFCQI